MTDTKNEEYNYKQDFYSFWVHEYNNNAIKLA